MDGIVHGIGSEVSLTAIALLALKVARDYLKERKERKAITGVSNPGNPGKGATSTHLLLGVVSNLEGRFNDFQRDTSRDITDLKVDVGAIKTKLGISKENER